MRSHSTGPGVRIGFHGGVVGVQLRLHQQDGADATGNVGHVAYFLWLHRAAQDFFGAVAEPLLDDLVAADDVLPDPLGDIAPVGIVIEVDVVGVRAEQCDRTAGFSSAPMTSSNFCSAG